MFEFVVADFDAAAAMLNPDGVFTVNDPELPRVGEEALDQSTLGAYLATRAATGERFGIVSMLVVGAPTDSGVRANLSLRHDLPGQASGAFSGYADYHCEQAQFTTVALVSDGPFDPAGHVAECEDIGAHTIEGLPHRACWLADLSDLASGS